MEVQKLKQVPLESMSKEYRERVAKMTAIFKRGVAEAKAENERLGIVSRESTQYSSAEDELAEIPLVSEKDPKPE